MNTTRIDYTPIQLKLPADMERIIEINDPVYTFNEVVGHIDLNKYFAEKDYKATGRPRYDREKLLKRNSFLWDVIVIRFLLPKIFPQAK